MLYPLMPPGGRSGLRALALCASLFAPASASAQPAGDPCGVARRADAVVFAVIGDFGDTTNKTTDATGQVAALVKNCFKPDFIITVGDNNYPCGVQANIDDNVGQFYSEYIVPYTGKYKKGTATANNFFPTLGNHDWGLTCPPEPKCKDSNEGATAYFNYFTLPDTPAKERYYSFTKGKGKVQVEFFALNSDCNENKWDGTTSDSKQAQWLKAGLAASKALYKIVYFHNPPYSSGEHGPTKPMRWDFEKWGATAVLTGHEHSYERLYLGSLPYIINGSGGVGLRPFPAKPVEPLVATSLCRNDTDHGAMLVTATADSISFQFFSTAVDKNKKPKKPTLLDNCSVPGKAGGSVADPCSGRRRRCKK